MKTKFISFVAVAAAMVLACRPGGNPGQASSGVTPSTGAPEAEAGQRLVALIDYVGADYGGAVRGGLVVSEFEYEEQRGFVASAMDLAAAAPGSDADRLALRERISALGAAVESKAESSVVAIRAKEARNEVMSRLRLETTPLNRPRLAEAERLYRESCLVCHGPRGDGETEAAKALDPRPRNFKDPERRDALSPYRVYNTLSLGVPGTSMPAFDALSPRERWDLAFYVLRLGHEGEAATGPTTMALADLAMRSDAEVRDALRAERHPDPAAGLAFARREAAFAEAPLGLGIEQTRALVARAASLGVAGERDAADRAALDAYLQGFEPLEAQISARDPNRTQSVEIAFRDFRGSLASGNAAAIDRHARVLDELIARAETRGPGTLPFVAAFIIYFREGVEAALLVGALLGGVRKLGRPEAGRAIHAGWALAVVAGGLTWLLFSRVIAVPASQREMVEAVLGLVAAIVLFSVSFWMISKAESRKWTAFLNDQLRKGLGSGRMRSLAFVAFLAVYRECAETILFTEALLIEATGSRAAVFAGAAVGLGVVAAVALLVQNALKRLPMPLFFATSGALLSLLAVAFAGSSVAGFVAAGWLSPRPLAFPSVPLLGIHPDGWSLSVQALLIAALAAGALKTFSQSRTADPGRPSAGSLTR